MHGKEKGFCYVVWYERFQFLRRIPMKSRTILGRGLCCGFCITISRRYNRLFVQSGFLELDQLVNKFIVFCQISFLLMEILWVGIDQINFSYHRCTIYFFISISILSLIISTCNSAALYALSNISATYTFRTITKITISVWNVHE